MEGIDHFKSDTTPIKVVHSILLNSINDINQCEWDALWPEDYPFTQHAFLAALENTGCTTAKTGWTPKHLIILSNEQAVLDKKNVLAIMPLYEKSHSYGEYVFDWGWADAYQRNGLPYYPKLLNAIPFTPATGPRLAFAPHLNAEKTQSCLALIDKTIQQQLIDIGGSGFHSVFTDIQSRSHMSTFNHMERQGCQFHWFNQNYKNFDDFLATFNSRKRKNLKKERKKVADQNIKIQFRSAEEISTDEWEKFYQLYQRTYFKRSGRAGYLSCDFFQSIAKAMPKHILLATAHQNSFDEPMLAAALYFRDKTTLYGRYWGTQEDIDGLHFETCYYQGIEFAIKHELERFDPGAQGEHKIQRGFTPIITSSYHKIMHPGFQQAIAEFIQEEKQQNHHYCINGRSYLPFKEDACNIAPDILIKK